MALSKHPADIEVRSKRTTFVVLFPNEQPLGGRAGAVIQRGTAIRFYVFRLLNCPAIVHLASWCLY